MPRISALLFDFDGLIVDTETPEFEIWETIFHEHGCVLPLDWWADSVGRGADQQQERPPEMLERLLGRAIDHEALAVEFAKRRDAIFKLLPARPGVVRLVEEARSLRIPTAVVSSSGHSWVDGHLARVGMSALFDSTVCREDATRTKPFPDLYLEAIRQFAIPPESTVALEDSRNGIHAAKAAGLVGIAVTNSVTALMDLSEADKIYPGFESITVEVLKSFVSG